MITDIEKYISIEEVADFLQVSKRTAYYCVQTMDIPRYRIGRLLRFKLSEVEEWTKVNKESQEEIEFYDINEL